MKASGLNALPPRILGSIQIERLAWDDVRSCACLEAVSECVKISVVHVNRRS